MDKTKDPRAEVMISQVSWFYLVQDIIYFSNFIIYFAEEMKTTLPLKRKQKRISKIFLLGMYMACSLLVYYVNILTSY